AASLLDHLVDLPGRSGVVRKGDPSPAAARGHGAVLGELRPVPEREDHAARLEEGHLVVGRGTRLPAEVLVELPGSTQVRGPGGDQGESLVHCGLLPLVLVRRRYPAPAAPGGLAGQPAGNRRRTADEPTSHWVGLSTPER